MTFISLRRIDEIKAKIEHGELPNCTSTIMLGYAAIELLTDQSRIKMINTIIDNASQGKPVDKASAIKLCEIIGALSCPDNSIDCDCGCAD